MTRRLRRLPWTAALAGAILLFVAWRAVSESPAPGLDSSWQAALQMAAHSSLDWGTQLVFTYGPLGWLRTPIYWYTDSGAWALLWVVAFRLALFSALWALARPVFGRLGALLLLLPIAWMVDDPEPALAFAIAVWLVAETRTPRAGAIAAGGLGVLGGIEVLGKINAGVTALIVGAIAVTLASGTQRVRRVTVFAVSALAALLVGWLGSGQPLGALPQYAHNALRIISGYSQTMIYETPGIGWNYWLVAALWLLVLGGIVKVLEPRDRRTRLMIALLWTAWVFVYFKAAFVRHDPGHTFLFFAATGPAVLILPWRRSASGRAVGTVLALASPLFFILITHVPLDQVLAPKAHYELARQQISGLWDGSRRRGIEQRGRAAVIAAEGLAPRTLAALRGQTVHVDPFETVVAWAYRLNWDPEPGFQGYQTYTQGLDGINEAMLRSERAPTRILYSPSQSIDGRLAAFDTPATDRAMLCRYSPLVTQEQRWIVLARGPWRCNTPTLVGSSRASWGEGIPVPVPTDDESIVYVKIAGAKVARFERVRAALYKALERTVDLGPAGIHRIAPAVSSDGLPLLAGARADYPPPFNLVPGAPSIAVDRADHPRGSTRPLRFDFYQVHVGALRVDPAKIAAARARAAKRAKRAQP